MELVGLLPVVVLACMMLLQGAAAIFATHAATQAARQAARADSLGGNAAAAADAAMPGGLRVASMSSFGPGHGVRVTVRIPRLAPVPEMTVTRQAVLP